MAPGQRTLQQPWTAFSLAYKPLARTWNSQALSRCVGMDWVMVDSIQLKQGLMGAASSPRATPLALWDQAHG